jgi:tetratricopeptide (TPR) repeat protein
MPTFNATILGLMIAIAISLFPFRVSGTGLPDAGGGAAVPPPPADTTTAVNSNRDRAQQLVNTAINLTDSTRAVNMLWQATQVDPTFEEAYIYLALYYNSRSQFDRVVQVYQRLVKYAPKETSVWLNIGEAYMSYSPPRFDAALPYYLKAFQLDPTSSFAALRLGEIYALENNRSEAMRYLRLARGDRTKNPEIAQQADRLIRQIGS